MSEYPVYSSMYRPESIKIMDDEPPQEIVDYEAEGKYVSPALCKKYGWPTVDFTKCWIYRKLRDGRYVDYEIVCRTSMYDAMFYNECLQKIFNPHDLLRIYLYEDVSKPELFRTVIEQFDLDSYLDLFKYYRRVCNMYRFEKNRKEWKPILKLYLDDDRCTPEMINVVPFEVHEDGKHIYGRRRLFEKHHLFDEEWADNVWATTSIGCNLQTFSAWSKKVSRYTDEVHDLLVRHAFGHEYSFVWAAIDFNICPKEFLTRLADDIEKKYKYEEWVNKKELKYMLGRLRN